METDTHSTDNPRMPYKEVAVQAEEPGHVVVVRWHPPEPRIGRGSTYSWAVVTSDGPYDVLASGGTDDSLSELHDVLTASERYVLGNSWELFPDEVRELRDASRSHVPPSIRELLDSLVA